MAEAASTWPRSMSRADTGTAARTLARRLVGPALGGGLLGGLAMIVVMILVMGTSGMGYASPLNLGMPAFVFTVTPPSSMFPQLMALMGIHLPPSAMAQLGPALHSGHLSGPMVKQLGGMLAAMHVPPAQIHMMGQLMTGHASNKDVANLMAHMSPSARHAVMAAMPVSAGRVAVGTILHFAFAGFLGLVFAGLIFGAAWFGVPGLRTSAGIITASIIGGALVYVVNRWGLLPTTNPMMRLVPQLAFFLTHLLYGAIVGVVLARVPRPELRGTH